MGIITRALAQSLLNVMLLKKSVPVTPLRYFINAIIKFMIKNKEIPSDIFLLSP